MRLKAWVNNLARADFLTSAGLYVSRDRVALVRLRKDLFRVSLVGEALREIPAAAGEGKRQELLVEAIRPLLRNLDVTRQPVYLCLSPDETLACEVLLPQVVRDNLRQVIEYEIERLIPLRRDELYYDFLTLGQKGDKIRVLLFAVPRRVLDEILRALSDLRVRVAGVETTPTALCNYFLFCAGASAGRALILASEQRLAEVIGLNVRGGIWAPEPEILFVHRVPRADWAQGPAKELFAELRQDSDKIFACGGVNLFFSATDGDAATEDLAAIAKRRLATRRESVDASSIPAIGAALRGLREATLQSDLQPEESRAPLGRKVSRLNALLAAFFGFALLILAASYPIRDEIRLARIQRELSRLEPAVTALRGREEKLSKLRREVSLLEAARARRGEILRLLEELSGVIPPSAYLTLLRYQDGNIELRGSAESASGLVPLLERSPLLKNVSFNAPTSRGRDNRESFSIKAEIER